MLFILDFRVIKCKFPIFQSLNLTISIKIRTKSSPNRLNSKLARVNRCSCAYFLLTIKGPTLSPVVLLCSLWEPSQYGQLLVFQQRQKTALSLMSWGVSLSVKFKSKFWYSTIHGKTWQHDHRSLYFNFRESFTVFSLCTTRYISMF